MKDRNGKELKIGDPVRIVEQVDLGEFHVGTEAEFRGVDKFGAALIYVKNHEGRGHHGKLPHYLMGTAKPTGDEYGHWWVGAEMIELIGKR